MNISWAILMNFVTIQIENIKRKLLGKNFDTEPIMNIRRSDETTRQ